MDEADRRAFLIRYAALALGALATSSSAAQSSLDGKKPPKALYGPPPRPPTATPTESTPPVALYGPPPRPVNPGDSPAPDRPTAPDRGILALPR